MSMKEMGKKYGVDLFHLINTSFSELYEYSPLTDKQIETYLKVYIPILNKDFVAVIVDADEQDAAAGIVKRNERTGNRPEEFSLVELRLFGDFLRRTFLQLCAEVRILFL